MGRVGHLAAILTILASPVHAQESHTVVRFPIRGTIPEDFDLRMQRVLTDAQGRGADALFLDIDAWQGKLDVVRTAIGWIQDAELPVYAFVNGVAYETGALVALATDRIFVTGSSSIGAQVPGRLDFDRDLINPVDQLRREFRALMELRNLDGALGDAMADRTVSIPGLVDTSTALTLTAQAAVDLGIASRVALNLDSAIRYVAFGGATVISANERGFTGATIEIQNNSWRDARVYLVRGSTRRRLGLITSMGTREYILEPEEIALGAAVRLVADPVGGAQDHVTESIRMVPGIVIQWILHNNPAQSNIFVFRP